MLTLSMFIKCWPKCITRRLQSSTYFQKQGYLDSTYNTWQLMMVYRMAISEARVSGWFQPLLEDFVGKIIRSDPSSIYFLVADTFFSWQAAVAEKFSIVRVSLWDTAYLSLFFGIPQSAPKRKGHYPLKDNVEEIVDYLPGTSVSTKDFMPYLKESDIDTISFRLVSAAFDHTHKADFVLHNAVHELESGVLSTLNPHQSHYAIGPINFYKNLSRNPIDKSLWAESSCTSWLQSKSPGSVLYISFGSVVPASKQMVQEVAHGLILSNVNFILVTRDAVEGSYYHIFPVGLEQELKDRGLIIPWCNQTMVLSDPAVGAFLTHSGWNSVIESIWNRVPMLCYPVDFDQPINRKLVVDDWGIGLNLCDGKTVNRTDIAEKIKSLINGSTTKEHIINLRDALRNAIEPTGSSERNFNQFITDLKEKVGMKSAGEQTS